MNKFLEIQLTKMTQEKMENLSSHMNIKEVKSVVTILPQGKFKPR